MTQIVLDARLQEQLRDTDDAVEFVDEAGNLVGLFCRMTSRPYDPKLIPALSDEERRHRAAQPGKYTTDEVLQHLRSL